MLGTKLELDNKEMFFSKRLSELAVACPSRYVTTEAATGPNPRSSRAREAQDMEEDHPLRPGERQGQEPS